MAILVGNSGYSQAAEDKRHAQSRVRGELHKACLLVATQFNTHPDDQRIAMDFLRLMPELAQTFSLAQSGKLSSIALGFSGAAKYIKAPAVKLLWPHLVESIRLSEKLPAKKAAAACQVRFPALFALSQTQP